MSADNRRDRITDPSTTTAVKLEIEKRRPSPEAVAAFAELQKDAPPGAGPIVRQAALLQVPKETPESERKEHLERAELRTNPVGEAAQPRVMRVPRREADAHVTSPDAYKRAKLGLAPPIAAMPIPGRSTQPLANVPPPPEPSSTIADVVVESSSKRRNWAWAALVFVLVGLMGGALIWYTEAVRVDERERGGLSAAPAATTTARETATAIAINTVPASASQASSSVASVPLTASEATPVRPPAATATAKRTARASAQPTTTATSTSERPND